MSSAAISTGRLKTYAGFIKLGIRGHLIVSLNFPDALALAIAHAHAIRFQDRQRPERAEPVETVPGTKGTRYERA